MATPRSPRATPPGTRELPRPPRPEEINPPSSFSGLNMAFLLSNVENMRVHSGYEIQREFRFETGNYPYLRGQQFTRGRGGGPRKGNPLLLRPDLC